MTLCKERKKVFRASRNIWPRQNIINFSSTMCWLFDQRLDQKAWSALPSWTYYRNDPKFSDRYAWANTADPDRSSLIRLYTVCHSVCIVGTHYCVVEPHSSNFRLITTNFLGIRIFRKFMVRSDFKNQCEFWKKSVPTAKRNITLNTYRGNFRIFSVSSESTRK